AERATVRVDGPLRVAEHVAPPDDIAVTQYDELRVFLLDVVEDEFRRLLERRRFQEREIFLFPRNGINRRAEAWNVVFGNRYDVAIYHLNLGTRIEIASSPAPRTTVSSLRAKRSNLVPTRLLRRCAPRNNRQAEAAWKNSTVSTF